MAHAHAKDDSVYDFFYIDDLRIGQLVSQLGENGILSELTRTAEDVTEVGGFFDVKLVKADHKNTGKTALSQRFDPRWLLPFIFLDLAAPLIQRDIDVCGIGQLVLVRGEPWMIDLSMVKGFLDKGIVKKALTQSLPTSTGRKGGVKPSLDPNVANGLELMSALPHGVQLRMQSEGKMVWAPLADLGLVTRASDAFLTHGLKISGEWVMVGILDAKPEPEEDAAAAALNDAIATDVLGPYAGMLANVATQIRPLLGRPLKAFGLTPLLVFREVSSA